MYKIDGSHKQCIIVKMLFFNIQPTLMVHNICLIIFVEKLENKWSCSSSLTNTNEPFFWMYIKSECLSASVMWYSLVFLTNINWFVAILTELNSTTHYNKFHSIFDHTCIPLIHIFVNASKWLVWFTILFMFSNKIYSLLLVIFIYLIAIIGHTKYNINWSIVLDKIHFPKKVSALRLSRRMHFPSFCLHHPCVMVSAPIPRLTSLSLCLKSFKHY